MATIQKKGFKSDLLEFRDKISNMQESAIPKEIIAEEDIVKAMILLNLISYQKIADVFLGCAAINLVNSYVKQDNPKLGYNFKRHLIELLKGVEDINQPKTIQIDYDNRNNQQILMIVIWNFQFSYKFIRYSEQIKKLQSPKVLEWDGLRKQPYAKTIFDFALSSPFITQETLGGNNLMQKLNDEVELYKSGKYKFQNDKLFKKGNFEVARDEEDKELKNYYRVKLCECKDRPVILTGRYKKTWDKHVTFITIRPYIEGVTRLTVCDHINLLRSDVEKCVDIHQLREGNRYYIIGYCSEYGNGRMGVRLATNENFMPLFLMNEFQRIPKDIISTCHRFSIEEYTSKRQKKMKL